MKAHIRRSKPFEGMFNSMKKLAEMDFGFDGADGLDLSKWDLNIPDNYFDNLKEVISDEGAGGEKERASDVWSAESDIDDSINGRDAE